MSPHDVIQVGCQVERAGVIAAGHLRPPAGEGIEHDDGGGLGRRLRVGVGRRRTGASTARPPVVRAAQIPRCVRCARRSPSRVRVVGEVSPSDAQIVVRDPRQVVAERSV